MPLKKLIAIANLGWFFFLHWFRKIKNIGAPAGYDMFLAHYRDDRIGPLDSDDHRRQNQFARCINCGLCAAETDGLAELRLAVNASPAMIASAFSRSQPEFWTAAEWAQKYETSARKWEKVCPRDVPIADALLFIRQKAIQPRN